MISRKNVSLGLIIFVIITFIINVNIPVLSLGKSYDEVLSIALKNTFYDSQTFSINGNIELFDMPIKVEGKNDSKKKNSYFKLYIDNDIINEPIIECNISESEMTLVTPFDDDINLSKEIKQNMSNLNIIDSVDKDIELIKNVELKVNKHTIYEVIILTDCYIVSIDNYDLFEDIQDSIELELYVDRLMQIRCIKITIDNNSLSINGDIRIDF